MTKQDLNNASRGPQAAITAMEQESLVRYVAGEGNDPAQFISRLEDREVEEEIEGIDAGTTSGKRICIIGLPRPNELDSQRKLWVGMNLSVVAHPPHVQKEILDRYVSVDFDEVLAQFSARGEMVYVKFLRETHESCGRRVARSFLIEKSVCKFL